MGATIFSLKQSHHLHLKKTKIVELSHKNDENYLNRNFFSMDSWLIKTNTNSTWAILYTHVDKEQAKDPHTGLHLCENTK